MVYKNILVHVYETKNIDATLKAACSIAEKNDAHLTGIHVIPHLDTPIYVESSVPAGLLKARLEAAEEAAERSRVLFQKAADSAGCLSEWCQPEGFVDQEIVRQGRYADLIVMGQSGAPDKSTEKHSLENQVLVTSSRPVLVVPYIGFTAEIGRHIMVAWNGSMEATRAVNDAMPLLQSADVVDVISIIGPKEQEEVPSADMCVYLARHGIKTEATKSLSNELTTSDILLNRASDRGIDLIVMGAYGHSRLREWILGGATYNMLKNMTVPVLMSH